MTAMLVRVINGQKIVRSILLDKIDRSQGNFTPYAQRAKQKLYIPYVNPLDTTVPGYVDLVPTDEVLLQLNLPKGVIFQLANAPVGAVTKYVTYFLHSGTLTIAPTVTAAVHAVPVGSSTITGTTFLSLTPDHTYVTLTNLTGSSQVISDTTILGGGGSIGATSIVVPNAVVTIGVPAAGWLVKVQANSKVSNTFTMT